MNQKEKIWEKINKDKLVIKPRWHYWMEWIGAGALAGVGLLTAAGLMETLISKYIDNKPQEWGEFGEIAKEMVWDEFGGIVLFALLGTGLGFWIWSKFGNNYKKELGTKIILYTTLVVVISGLMFLVL